MYDKNKDVAIISEYGKLGYGDVNEGAELVSANQIFKTLFRNMSTKTVEFYDVLQDRVLDDVQQEPSAQISTYNYLTSDPDDGR